MTFDDFPVTAFIGGGNMARALIGGAVAAGIPPGSLRVGEPDEGRRQDLERAFGVATFAGNADAARGAGLVVLAVKPQVAPEACSTLETALGDETLVLSIMAGVRTESLAAWLGAGRTLIRAMPNTPALVRAGITTLYMEDGADPTARDVVEQLLGVVGETLWVPDENWLDPATAVAGSGPAYLFLLAEALAAAGVSAGLDEATADRLARFTLRGAAEMTLQEGADPATLRQQVTSPGGTTAAALEVLEKGGFRDLLEQAVLAATRRARELGSR